MHRRVAQFLTGLFIVGAALAAPLGASGAGLEKGLGHECPAGEIGTWHFVNVQTNGYDGPGSLTAIFTILDEFGAPHDVIPTVGPSRINQNLQHFVIRTPGVLLFAFTDLEGSLRLTSVKCEPV